MNDLLRERLLILYRTKGDARLAEIGEFNLILHTAQTQLAIDCRDLVISEDDIKESHIQRFNLQTGEVVERTLAHACIKLEVFKDRISEALKRLDPSILL